MDHPRLLLLTLLVVSFHQSALTQEQSGNSVGLAVDKAVELTNQLDFAKEKATRCRHLVILAELDGKKDLQHKAVFVRNLFPKMVSDCYESMNSIANRTMEQLGANVTLATFNSPNRTRTDYEFSNTSSSLLRSRDHYVNERRDAILREGFSNGADYCSHFSVGIMADLSEFINNDLFGKLNFLVPQHSALASLANLERLNQLELQHSGRNISIYQMLQIVRKCKQRRSMSDSSEQIERLLSWLGKSPDCKWSDVFILQQLYAISNNNTTRRRQPLDLAGQTHSIMASCLADLHRANAASDVISFSQTERFKPFTQNLIDYLSNGFFEGSTNLLDALNPRSLLNHNIEFALFFNKQLHGELTKAGQDLTQFYIDGKGLCDSLTKKRIFSSDTVPKWLPDHMDKISLILGIDNLQLNLKLQGNDSSFHYALVWNMCQTIKLFPMPIVNPIYLS